MAYTYDPLIGPDYPGFSEVVPWSATIYGVEVTWSPRAPYLTSKVKNGDLAINQITEFLARRGGMSLGAGTYISDVDGMTLPASVWSPYAVIDAICAIYVNLDDDSDSVVFSETTPTYSGEEDLDPSLIKYII